MQGVFLNLGPPSKVTPAEAASDINAILETGPAFMFGCESVGKGPLPSRTDLGYVKIRDRRKQSRSNIYAYVKAGDLPTFHWRDMELKFPKEPGRKGMHDPRSFLKFNWRKIQFYVAHHPPGWPGTGPARAEHLRELRHDFAPWTDEHYWNGLTDKGKGVVKRKARVLFWDRNMPLPAFRKFAETCDAWVVGETVDSMMYRNLASITPGYTRKFGNHLIHTDHRRGAFVVEFKLGLH